MTTVADVQKQVDETADIMRDNIDVALANQEKAEELSDKAGLFSFSSFLYFLFFSFMLFFCVFFT